MSSRASRLGAIAVAVASALVVPHGDAFAADPTPAELAAARQMFNEAKDLETKGDWENALAEFRKVGEVKMTPQVRFHIALAEEHTGKLVAAINDFERAAEEAKQPGANATEVAENAPVRASALRQRVPHVRLTVTGTIERSRILLDGAPVAGALVGTDLPVDIGKHVIEVERDGETIAHQDLDLAEGASQTVPLEVDDASAPPPKPVETASAPEPPPPPPPAPPPRSKLPMYAAAGVGVASLVGAGVFFAMRQSTIDEIRATCPNDVHCDPSLQATADDGMTYTVVAGVLAGVGVAGLGTAGVLWLTSPKAKAQATAVRVAPTLGGVQVLGRF